MQGGEQGLVVRLLHEGEGTVLQGFGHLAQQLVRRLRPVGLLQHRAGIFQAALGHRPVGAAQLVKLIQNFLGLLRTQEAHFGDLQGKLFHVVRLHMLVEGGRPLHAQGDNDSGRPLRTGEGDLVGNLLPARGGLGLRGCGSLLFRHGGVSHCLHPPSASS